MPASACTVTRSPATNGLVGMKLSPVLVEYACKRPGCVPLREPATLTFATVVPAPPRKLICVVGDASGVPGSGETVTGLAAAAATDAWSPSAIEAGVALPPQEPSATASSAARNSAPRGLSMGLT